MEHALILVQSLNNLTYYVQNFNDALLLYKEVSRLIDANTMPPAGWLFIPCRDAGMTIFHFSILLKAIRSSVRHIPTLKDKVNSPLLRTANKKFDSAFPDAENMRHAIAHQAELTEDMEALRSNQLVGDGGYVAQNTIRIAAGKRVMIQDHIVGDTFYNVIDGKLVQFDFSQASIETLVRIRDDYFEAFAQIREV